MKDGALAGRIEAVRRFNRFYTRQLGLLEEHLARTSFSLSEARVLHEVAQRHEPTASTLAAELKLDAGYLSRILRRLRSRGLIRRRASEGDRRRHLLTLTESGRTAYAELDAASRAQVEQLLRVAGADQARLVAAMASIESILEARDCAGAFRLRHHRPGDMGWVVHRHGEVYHREYGWDERFEALVAEIVAHFVRHFDPLRERCWIAERAGRRLGSVFLVRHPERSGVARLRLLLVEPEARGSGLGGRLVRECTRFARAAGYERLTLWTNSILDGARRLYEREGYRLVREEPHNSYGAALVGQHWELELAR